MNSGTVQRAWLGVTFQELTQELASGFGTHIRGGALVSSVEPSGPASQAGVKAGDIIEKVDGVKVEDGRGLQREVLKKKVGQKIPLQVLREGKRVTLHVSMGKRPADLSQAGRWQGPSNDDGDDAERFGFNLRFVPPEEAQRMGKGNKGLVVVQHVEPGSLADRAGLQPGDVIVQADRKPVHSVETLRKALRDGEALLRVENRGTTRFVALRRED